MRGSNGALPRLVRHTLPDPMSSPLAAPSQAHSPTYTHATRIADLPRPQAAMKARDSQRLDAIRYLSAAIKQREIELRETGKEVGGEV